MKIFSYAIIALLCTSQAAFAVLPPLYQSLGEIEMILRSPELSKYLTSADIIENIQRTENGYLVQGSKHQVAVRVIALPAKMPGPTQFRLEWPTFAPKLEESPR
jgi:hypothetical protein